MLREAGFAHVEAHELGHNEQKLLYVATNV